MTTTAGLGVRQRRVKASRLAISEVAVTLFGEQGFAETTVEQIVARAGVSLRTFHRYFPTKADCAAPILEAGVDAFVNSFAAARHDRSTVDAVVDALAAWQQSEQDHGYTPLLRKLPRLPQLRAVWLRVFADCEDRIAPIVAARLGAEPDSVQSTFAAAAAVAALRVALETRLTSPLESVLATARACLRPLDDALFRAAAGE